MRLCFYNPQAVNSILGDIFIARLLRSNKDQVMAAARCNYLLEILRDDRKNKTAIVVDGTATSLMSGSLKIRFLLKYPVFIKLISYFEIYYWCFLNKINPFSKKIIFNFNNLEPKNDVLLAFGCLTCTFFDESLFDKSFFKKFSGKKVLHMTHYFLNTSKNSSIINKTKINAYLAEANLLKNKFFCKFYKTSKMVVLPLVLRNKYMSYVPYKERKNICLALGSLTFFDRSEVFNDYISFFKINHLHPVREMIYKNKQKIKHVIDCEIHPTRAALKKSLDKKILAFFNFKKTKNDYYSFNVVDKLNKYKMFVSAEENIGLPSINFIEGMACGCAYLGLKSYIYEDLGLVDGINYIAYDGTLPDLINKINYYQKHQKKLQKIAESGCQYVRSNFKKEMVVNKFLRDMEKIFFSK